MGLKSMLMGETTIASVEKAILRAKRELQVANTAVHDASVAYDVALEDGAEDEVLRAALDRKQTAGWQVGRLTKRLAGQEAQLVQLRAEARAAQLATFKRELVQECKAHGAAHAAAVATAARVVERRGAMEAAGFARDLIEFEMFPPNLLDMTTMYSAHPDLARHETLDRWRYRVSQIEQTLQVQS